MTENARSWPLKPSSKTSGQATSNPALTDPVLICQAELQDGLPSRPWRVLLVNNGPGNCDFFLIVGDDYGTNLVIDSSGLRRRMAVEGVPGVGVPPTVAYPYGNWFELTVVGRSVTVYGIHVGVWSGNWPNLFAAVAPEGLSFPILEP